MPAMLPLLPPTSFFCTSSSSLTGKATTAFGRNGFITHPHPSLLLLLHCPPRPLPLLLLLLHHPPSPSLLLLLHPPPRPLPFCWCSSITHYPLCKLPSTPLLLPPPLQLLTAMAMVVSHELAMVTSPIPIAIAIAAIANCCHHPPSGNDAENGGQWQRFDKEDGELRVPV